MTASLSSSFIVVCLLMQSTYFIKVIRPQISSPGPFRKLKITIGEVHQTRFYDLTRPTRCCFGTATNCDSTCPRYFTVSINGNQRLNKRLDYQTYSTKYGDYIGEIHVDNHSPDQSVFESLTIQFSISAINKDMTLARGEYNDSLFAPNSDYVKKGFELEGSAKVTIVVSFYCNGYVGYNCRYPCQYGSAVDCLFEDGTQYCKDGSKNPPMCNRSEIPCTTNVCENGGRCVQYTPTRLGCICSEGFSGPLCQNPVCTTVCHPDRGFCGAQGRCECYEGFTGTNCSQPTCESFTKCQNGGICVIKDGLPLCDCDNSLYGGDYCEHKCDNRCTFGFCFPDENGASCVCFPGFQGQNCDDATPTMAPIVDPYYVPPHRQRIILFGLITGLLTISIIVIASAIYIRKKRTRNKSVQRRAEYVVKTLTGMPLNQRTLYQTDS